MIKYISKEDKPKIKPGCLIVSLGVWGFFIFIIISIIISTRPKTYKSFGDEEMEIINKKLGITIKGSTTPVKLRVDRGRDPDYELWLENIDDPEEFMENCYDGTYSVVENVDSLRGFGNEGREYDYDNGLSYGSAYIIYNCDRYFEYNIAFYKDGDSFKAKLYADDR